MQAIHGFRETEKSQWNDKNKEILNRLRDLALPPGAPQISSVHVLDLAKKGYIKPHIDSVRVSTIDKYDCAHIAIYDFSNIVFAQLSCFN